MDGDTKQISYNGKVLKDFNKNPDGGFALGESGDRQDPSSLEKGDRDTEWFELKGFTLIVDLLNLLIGREPDKATNPKGGVN